MTGLPATDVLPTRGALRLGSLCVHVDAPQRIYLEDLAAIYCAALHDPANAQAAGLHLEIVESPSPPSVNVPHDGLVVTPKGDLYTEAMFAQTTLGDGQPRVRLTVFKAELADDERRIYLVVLLNKVLSWMGYTRLHASAVSLDGNASVFIGDRGAGKSSICAYLAGRGGLVLADDDVMLHYDGSSCSVSGCDETMRIMPDAENYLFGQLDVPALDFGGFLKKQIFTADRFATDPYVDYGLDRVFFPRVGESFAVNRLPSSHLVMRMMSALIPANRFSGTLDHERTLSYLTDVADQVVAYDLTLTRTFDGLDQLYGFLKETDK